jgi:hypothetical protein
VNLVLEASSVKLAVIADQGRGQGNVHHLSVVSAAMIGSQLPVHADPREGSPPESPSRRSARFAARDPALIGHGVSIAESGAKEPVLLERRSLLFGATLPGDRAGIELSIAESDARIAVPSARRSLLYGATMPGDRAVIEPSIAESGARVAVPSVRRSLLYGATMRRDRAGIVPSIAESDARVAVPSARRSLSCGATMRRGQAGIVPSPRAREDERKVRSASRPVMGHPEADHRFVEAMIDLRASPSGRLEESQPRELRVSGLRVVRSRSLPGSRNRLVNQTGQHGALTAQPERRQMSSYYLERFRSSTIAAQE